MSFSGGGSKKEKATYRGTSYRSAQKVSAKNVWYKRIEVKIFLIQQNFGTKIGSNIVFNIMF